MSIVTIFNDKTACLSRKAQVISNTAQGLQEAKQIVNQLMDTLKPLMPAAGLAAPQIGISKQVFIYSWDRSLEHMVAAINPKIIEFGKETYYSWESCFSTRQENSTLQAVYVERAKQLVVEYMDLNGDTVRLRLDGFGAKVFQHEYDHLQGIVDTQKENVELKTFETEQKLIEFMMGIRKEDSLSYIEPVNLS